MKTTPGTAEGRQTRRKPSGYRSIKEEFHIRKRVVEAENAVEVDLRQEEVEIRRPDKARDRKCPVGAPRSGTPAREGD